MHVFLGSGIALSTLLGTLDTPASKYLALVAVVYSMHTTLWMIEMLFKIAVVKVNLPGILNTPTNNNCLSKTRQSLVVPGILQQESEESEQWSYCGDTT